MAPSTWKRWEVQTLSNDFRTAAKLVTEREIPDAQEHSLIVRNEYVGINATDINITNGAYTKSPPPFGCGLDAVGVVAAVGSGVKGFQVGDVVAYRKLGAFAEYVEVEAAVAIRCSRLSPLPIPLLVCGTSASIALEQVGQMKSNETVLVTAAAGGTGQFVVQLAKLAGNHVIGTCSNQAKADYLRSIGCDRVINYTEEDVAQVLQSEYPHGIDLVFETIGGDMFRAAVENIAVHGRIILFGFISAYKQTRWDGSHDSLDRTGMLVQEMAPTLLLRSASVRGFISGNHREHFQRHFELLSKMIDDKQLKVNINSKDFHGIEQVPNAIDYMYSKKNIGKIVVKLPQDQ